MPHNAGEFTSRDGLRLAEPSWRPDGEPNAVVVIEHGLYDYGDYYANFAEQLAGKDYAVHTFDLRGHGRSEGRRSFVNSFDDYVGDLHLFVTRRRERNEGKPIFVLAHSMGGAMSTLYVLTRQPALRGLLLSGAALKESADVSPLLKRVTPIIGNLFPMLPAAKLDLNYASRDPEVVKRKRADPLIDHKAIPARTGAELLSAFVTASEQICKMSRCPC